MDKGYKTIFWGLFFASFHINLGLLKILPNFVAWAIIAVGVEMLYKETLYKYLSKASVLSNIAVLYTVVTGILSLINPRIELLTVYNLVATISFALLELLIEFYILEGSIEYFDKNGLHDVIPEFVKYQRNYSIVFLLFTLVGCIALTLQIEELMYFYAIIVLLLRISFLVYMRKLYRLTTNEVSVRQTR
jgi:hypothetical protein